MFVIVIIITMWKKHSGIIFVIFFLVELLTEAAHECCVLYELFIYMVMFWNRISDVRPYVACENIVVKQVTLLLCIWQVSGLDFALEVAIMTGVLWLCQDAQANVWYSTPVY
jgi:hypothetical protein